MPDGIAFKLDDGTSVVFAPVLADGSRPVALSDRLKDTEKKLRDALAPVTAAATQVVDSFQKAARRPDEIEVTFGVMLDAKLGAVITSVSANAHLDVTLRWHAPEKESSPSPGADGSVPGPTAPLFRCPPDQVAKGCLAAAGALGTGEPTRPATGSGCPWGRGPPGQGPARSV